MIKRDEAIKLRPEGLLLYTRLMWTVRWARRECPNIDLNLDCWLWIWRRLGIFLHSTCFKILWYAICLLLIYPCFATWSGSETTLDLECDLWLLPGRYSASFPVYIWHNFTFARWSCCRSREKPYWRLKVLTASWHSLYRHEYSWNIPFVLVKKDLPGGGN